MQRPSWRISDLGRRLFTYRRAAQRGARHPTLQRVSLPLDRNMSVFRRLVWVALCAGLLSGLFATAAHQIGTVPVILQAEVYEKAAERLPAQAPEQAASPTHEHAVAWEPESGVARTAYTLLADLLTGVGFALLLAAGLALRGGEVTWRDGLFWGLAGFAAI